jgi:hypothetical protein
MRPKSDFYTRVTFVIEILELPCVTEPIMLPFWQHYESQTTNKLVLFLPWFRLALRSASPGCSARLGLFDSSLPSHVLSGHYPLRRQPEVRAIAVALVGGFLSTWYIGVIMVVEIADET